MKYVSRNDALEFARRTEKNLDYIAAASNDGADVHVVTQLANSLLGLIVFPWEENFVSQMGSFDLDELNKRGWPTWTVTVGRSSTLAELVRNLRHAVAHGNLRFSSDSPVADEVSIEANNYWPQTATEPIWTASLEAAELDAFCRRFIDLIEDSIG